MAMPDFPIDPELLIRALAPVVLRRTTEGNHRRRSDWFRSRRREGSRRRRAAPVPLAIRRRFEERFTARRMALEYLDVYRSLIEFQALRSRVTVARASIG
jgi:hypothetical protein